jgi:hypothetical protein
MRTEQPPKLSYYAGLDLGRTWEHTALAVVERAESAEGHGDMAQMRYAVRHLEAAGSDQNTHSVCAGPSNRNLTLPQSGGRSASNASVRHTNRYPCRAGRRLVRPRDHTHRAGRGVGGLYRHRARITSRCHETLFRTRTR